MRHLRVALAPRNDGLLQRLGVHERLEVAPIVTDTLANLSEHPRALNRALERFRIGSVLERRRKMLEDGLCLRKPPEADVQRREFHLHGGGGGIFRAGGLVVLDGAREIMGDDERLADFARQGRVPRVFARAVSNASTADSGSPTVMYASPSATCELASPTFAARFS